LEQIKLCIEWRVDLDDEEREFVMSLSVERRLDRYEAANCGACPQDSQDVARCIEEIKRASVADALGVR
jgi:hypothetical protein